jgi:hypothetical protein
MARERCPSSNYVTGRRNCEAAEVRVLPGRDVRRGQLRRRVSRGPSPEPARVPAGHRRTRVRGRRAALLEQCEQQSWDPRVTSVSDELPYELAATSRVIGRTPGPARRGRGVSANKRRDVISHAGCTTGSCTTVMPRSRARCSRTSAWPALTPGWIRGPPTSCAFSPPRSRGTYPPMSTTSALMVERWSSVSRHATGSPPTARFLCLGGVTADLAVAKPPASAEDAFALSAQLIMFGGNFQGLHRWLAVSLRTADEWHLFDRPQVLRRPTSAA